MTNKMRTAIFFSGRGSNMGALINAAKNDDYPLDIALAVTDNPNAGGIDIVGDIPVAVTDGKGAQMERALTSLLVDNKIELILLAGFMRLVSPEFVDRWYGRILNIHPSLLPEFKGLHPQQQAIDAKATESGCTVHIVTAEMDGGPILGQSRVPVYADDNAENLGERILREEHKLYPHIAAQYADYLRVHPITDTGLLKTPFSAVKEECGVFAVHSPKDALPLTVFGLHSLQHRGQEGVGVASIDDGEIAAHHAPGLVGDNFGKAQADNINLPGEQMIGHLRYSTSGGKVAGNLQPFVMQTRFGSLALAHNGNLSNSEGLRRELMDAGQVFFTNSDSEVFLHLVAQSSKETLKEAIIDACKQVVGAFSIMVLSDEGIYAARDGLGLRPLSLGMKDGTIGIASESTALEATDLDWQYDIDAGELLHLDPQGGIIKEQYLPKKERVDQKFCAFEYVYFMRANSAFNGRYTARVRERIGMELFNESPAPEADYVVPVPESGIFAAIGYSQIAKLPFHFAILKSSYVGRTFIEPEQSLRNFGVRLKLSIDRFHIQGKRIVLVDDSIVRATTLPKIIELLRGAGAAEIHVRIASPEIRYPCFYGIDMPSRAELSAANNNLEELRELVDADSLAFISTEGLRRAIDAKDNETMEQRANIAPHIGTCMACFTGEYPAPLCDSKMQKALEGSEAKYTCDSPGRLFENRRNDVKGNPA